MKKLFKSRSQARQDEFAFQLGGMNGTYLEVGASHPRSKNNTYNLETRAGWKGISIELDDSYKETWLAHPERQNKIYFDNALTFNYAKALRMNGLPTHLNYLSCDIEPVENTFAALKRIIESGISFDCITFEDDRYRNDLDYNVKAEEFLKDHGYKTAVINVYAREPERLFETWFVKDNIKFEEKTFEHWLRENI